MKADHRMNRNYLAHATGARTHDGPLNLGEVGMGIA